MWLARGAQPGKPGWQTAVASPRTPHLRIVAIVIKGSGLRRKTPNKDFIRTSKFLIGLKKTIHCSLARTWTTLPAEDLHLQMG
jgi:hypothetical protein